MESFSPKEYIHPKAPVHAIKSSEAWSQLTDKEKLYAYYFYKACWEGSMICWFQRSYEAPALFVLLKLVFTQDFDELKQAALEKVTEDEWKAFLAYSAGVFNNCGNYRSFGDTKFVPQIPEDKFWEIIQASKNYSIFENEITNIWTNINLEVYNEDPPYFKIGWSNNQENSSYYSSNITKEEATMIDSFMKENNISPLNTRLIKTSDGFEVKLASTNNRLEEELPYLKNYTYQGQKIKITRGDFSWAMNEIAKNLKQAKFYAANDTQKQMLDHYVKNFISGDMNAHKDAMKEWIKDVDPAIETNIGYIETYLDPLGVRAEYEGFVSIVNKETSKLFSKLVDNAEKLIEYLPWGKDFEKDKFNKPDFTSLNVLAFACSGTPIGINLPNYDDIRENLGYKNVDLGNVYPKPTYENIQYMEGEMKDLYYKYSNESLTLMVALHELLGHGTGKLLTQDVDTGKFNFDQEKLLNPFTGEKISTFYKSNETWSSKFGKLHSGYEECRADTVALYLGHFEEPYQIFFADREDEWLDIEYVMWLDIIRGALVGLQFYDEASQQWGQAHIIAGYVIMKVLHEAGDVFSVDFTEKDGKEYFNIKFDKENVKTKCFDALKPFLKKLHILKSMGDFDEAEKWFNEYCKVDDHFLRIKRIVEANKLPRRLEIQPNLLMSSFNNVEYKDYDQTHEGIVRSYVERFPDVFYSDVYEEWASTIDLYRISQ
ncbi:unnamed protein product [Moneuplotes crassus]|uniref:Dipeptidyl peptidase 3 n=3 Tax=Euplotes crassus TaxID=5936 RepID=A0AAD2DCI3_EUPCR|nr:unnamed protein product [Moneuplotes crassus]